MFNTMAFLGFLKKKGVPDELPDLATDELEKNLKSEIPEPPAEVTEAVPEKGIAEEPKTYEKPVVHPSDKRHGSGDYAEELKKAVLEHGDKAKGSFFDEIQRDISKELSDVDKMEDWYENKFLPRDILSDMRQYWENQKANSVIQILGKNFKERINNKTEELQTLEKEWQDIYFDLVEKEDEIRNGEEELKKMLSEFVEVCRRKKRILEENGGKKTKNKSKK